MKKDNWEEYKDKYFDGSSNAEEEKFLKENGADDLFSVLKEEKEARMQWEFSAFMQSAGQPKAKIVPIENKSFKMYWMAAASVIAIVLCGILFFQNNQDKPASITAQNSNKAGTPAITAQPQMAHNNVQQNNKNNTTIATTKKQNNTNNHLSLAVHHAMPRHQKPIVDVNPETDTTGNNYNPNYVLVNGKPVHSEAEATQITMNAVSLLSDNVSKGANELAIIKKLSIKL